MEKIELLTINVKGTIVEYLFCYSDGLKRFFNGNRVVTNFDCDISQVPKSILSIPFVASMSGLSWIADTYIFVDELDETFYHSYRSIKSAYQDLHSDYPFGGVLVPSIIKSNIIDKTDDAILLFGGGIDCQTSFLRNRERISYICNIYGWLSSLDCEDTIDIAEKNSTDSFAQRMHVKSLHVRSSIFSIFNLNQIDKKFSRNLHTGYWYGFLHSMTFIAIAIQLGVSLGLSNVMIASSYTKGRIDPVCASLITTDSEFSYATNGRTIHDGFELNRQDKVGVIVRYQKETGENYPLQVCSFNDHNCCECEKCFRTIVGIAAEGADPRLFGFNYTETLTEHLKDVMNRRLYNWGLKKESFFYYYYTKKKIQENYSSPEMDKDFAEWFLSFDFEKEHRKAKLLYYKKNLTRILKRKIIGR